VTPEGASEIDVVVPTYGNYELTLACLRSLAGQTAAHRVIVVDDGSPDDSAERVRSEWPEVTLLELGSNHGFTRAVNRGAAAGSGRHVVLLNNDVELRPECLERLVVPLRADATVGSVAALLLCPGERAIDSLGVSADPTLAGFARLQGHPPEDALGAGTVLTGPEGTAGAYRREAWEQVGGLDERIGAYMEILDLALRLRSGGWGTAQAPEAIGIHLGSRTYGHRSARQRRIAGFSRGYLLRRYGVLRRGVAPRALLTETLVVLADAVLCHDVEAARGRLQGWRAARGLEGRPWPPPEAIDSSISLRRSLALRRGAIARSKAEG
jgi:GT2 family glycosyltransferase